MRCLSLLLRQAFLYFWRLLVQLLQCRGVQAVNACCGGGNHAPCTLFNKLVSSSKGSGAPALEAQGAAGVIEANVAVGWGARIAKTPFRKGSQLREILQQSRPQVCYVSWVV